MYEFNFHVVPDYVCSGVVEHYVKFSITLRNPMTKEMVAVFSAIVNKKTGCMQRQAKTTNLTFKRVRTAVYGYSHGPTVAETPDALADLYPKLTDDEKNFLWRATYGIWGTIKTELSRSSWNPQGLAEAKDFYEKFMDAYNAIRGGGYAKAAEAVAEPTAETAEGPTEEETPKTEPPTERKRATTQMARMIVAHGLTEFANGNFYRLADMPYATMNGNNYIPLLNENGEVRFVAQYRVQFVETFTEPPTGCECDC